MLNSHVKMCVKIAWHDRMLMPTFSAVYETVKQWSA